jgi:hypothetical protein
VASASETLSDVLTRVPADSLIRMAVAVAWSLRVTPSGTVIEPLIVVVSSGAGATGTSTLTVGPPVMTGTGTWAGLQADSPSTTWARIA